MSEVVQVERHGDVALIKVDNPPVNALGLASEAARQVRQPVLLGALAQQLFQAFSNQGNGQLDFSAIVKLYQEG